MENNNIFQMSQELRQQLDWLNQILKGTDQDIININGVIKPSITKDIADRWGAIQMMVNNGSRAFERLSILIASGQPPLDKPLANVWNDGDNNGLYGWNGSSWVLSDYDRLNHEMNTVYNVIYDLVQPSKLVKYIGASNHGAFQPMSINGHQLNVLPLYIDDNGRLLFGATENGEFVCALNNITTSQFGIENYSGYVGYQGVEFAILDSYGRSLLAFDKNGELIASDALLNGVDKHIGNEKTPWPVNGEYEFVILDADSRVAFGVRRDGTLFIGDELKPDNIAVPLVSDVRKNERNYRSQLTDYNFTLVQGQSLSRGWDFTQSPALSLTQPFNNKALPEPNWPNTSATQFTPLVERQEYPWTETVCSGSANQTSFMLDQMLRPWENITHDQVLACNGIGGATIRYLVKGTDAWHNGLSYLQTAVNIAHKEGKSIGAHGTFWIQGESDNNGNPPGDEYDSTWYKKTLIQLKNDYNSDAMLITKQSDRIPLFTYQTTSHAGSNQASLGVNHWPAASLGQLSAAMDDPEVVMVCPIYQFSFSDNAHMDNHGYRHMGHYFAKAYFEWVFKQRKFKPLHPLSIKKVSDTQIDINFYVPSPPLVFDTDRVIKAKDFGFVVHKNDSQQTEIEISGVSIHQNTVSLTCNEFIPDDAIVSYARRVERTSMKGPAGHGGCRGNLRDSDPTLAFDKDVNGQPYSLFNWCVFFIQSVEV